MTLKKYYIIILQFSLKWLYSINNTFLMQVSDIKTRLLGFPHRKCTPGRPSSVYSVNGTHNILCMCFKAPRTF